MSFLSRIAAYAKNRAALSLVITREFFVSLFNRGYRVYFSNFWYRGEQIKDIWFYPLIAEVFESKSDGRKCRISPYRPHVEMFSVLGGKRAIKDSRARRKVFFSGECVRSKTFSDWLRFGDYCLGDVDLALGFDHEGLVDNPKYMRFPLWILYFFKANDSKDEIARKVREFNDRRFSKSKFCALIARHDANGLRTEIFESLSGIGRVDAGGRVLHNDDSLEREFGDDKDAYLRQYEFNICPENTRGDGYVTEKLFQAFSAGCVPIYSGCGLDPEPEVVNKNAVIFWEQGADNSESLALIRGLHENPEAYEKFLSANRPLKEGAVDFVWRSLEELRRRFEEILA